jgi:insulysin
VLASADGSDNAFTSSLHTNFFFDSAPNDAFLRALQVWSQFFVAPLFDANSTSKELNAVNAEHDKNLRSDAWRAEAVLRNASDARSAFSYFSTGDRDTLETTPAARGIDVRAALLAFYKEHYVASNMKLVVLGSDTVGELKDAVTRVRKGNISFFFKIIIII